MATIYFNAFFASEIGKTGKTSFTSQLFMNKSIDFIFMYCPCFMMSCMY
ncbi:hypothetical protein BAT_0357 [Bacillus pumilus ATCC 7061]|nr:hypothetical protein BAT_0357 [Bacillus pumilus ATCC 7061]